MPITSNYFLPAILLNPVIILHTINTYLSYQLPSSSPLTSTSPHPLIEKLGPLPNSSPYIDVHSSGQVCWTYTMIMVIAQIFAYFRVGGNRIERKRRKGGKVKVGRWSPPGSPGVEVEVKVGRVEMEMGNGRGEYVVPRMRRQVRLSRQVDEKVAEDDFVGDLDGAERRSGGLGDEGSDEDTIMTETSDEEMIP